MQASQKDADHERAASGHPPHPFGHCLGTRHGHSGGPDTRLVSTRLIESLLYQVKGSDLVQLAAPCLIVLLAAIMAAAPAVARALHINPVDLLRAE